MIHQIYSFFIYVAQLGTYYKRTFYILGHSFLFFLLMDNIFQFGYKN